MNDTNTMTATATATAPKMFTKFCTNDFVKAHVKEARRVKYTVVKDGFGYTISDGANIVMKALKYNNAGWLVRFSSLYWNDESAI